MTLFGTRRRVQALTTQYFKEHPEEAELVEVVCGVAGAKCERVWVPRTVVGTVRCENRSHWAKPMVAVDETPEQ